MTDRLFVLLPAAGRATRFSSPGEVPKQYQFIAGRTVLEWSLQAMRLMRPERIVLAVADDDLRWQSLPDGCLAGVQVVAGGADRAVSVLRALSAIAAVARADDWALVHDVARPCVTEAECVRLHAAIRLHPVGGVLAVPVADTVKRVAHAGAARSADVGAAAGFSTAMAGGVGADVAESVQTIDRTMLWLAQTPQQFRYGALVAALESAMAVGVSVTDEASAMELAGHRPLLVRGSVDNIKITWPDDLARAAGILGRQLRAAHSVRV